MSQNVGTLVSAAIRPNDSLDPIASAFAGEIKGGLHSATASSNRDSIIFERREWGMMCYVINDDKTYQLTYNYADTNIMNNSNWVEFSGSGGNDNEWIDSVISILLSEPLSPSGGDRYLVGTKPSDIITGTNWSAISPGFVAEWNSGLLNWDITYPTEGMSVRVDNEDNSIYRYETDGGLNNYPNGFWQKEKLGQVRSIDASFIGGFSYSTTSDPSFSGYIKDMIFLTKFDTVNLGETASLNINGLGDTLIKKTSLSGLINLNPYDISTDVVYSLVYDGTYFQLNRPFNEDLFNIKYYIEPTDYIVIPPYYQYFIYGDLVIDGSLVNYGELIISNGSLINSGTFSNFGTMSFVNSIGISDVVAGQGLTGGGSLSSITMDVQVSNGLSISDDNIALGGTLSQNTTINGDGYDITISNADYILITSSVFDVESDFVSLDSGSGSTQILSGGDISISTGGDVDLLSTGGVYVVGSSFSVNGVEIDPTSPTTGYVLTYDGTSFIPQSLQSPYYGQMGITLSNLSNIDGVSTTISIDNTPNYKSHIQIYINGQLQMLGNGITYSDCYFSDDGGVSAKYINSIISGDVLYWNSLISGFSITNTDKLSIVYSI